MDAWFPVEVYNMTYRDYAASVGRLSETLVWTSGITFIY
jgi:hypothetical protein